MNFCFSRWLVRLLWKRAKTRRRRRRSRSGAAAATPAVAAAAARMKNAKDVPRQGVCIIV